MKLSILLLAASFLGAANASPAIVGDIKRGPYRPRPWGPPAYGPPGYASSSGYGTIDSSIPLTTASSRSTEGSPITASISSGSFSFTSQPRSGQPPTTSSSTQGLPFGFTNTFSIPYSTGDTITTRFQSTTIFTSTVFVTIHRPPFVASSGFPTSYAPYPYGNHSYPAPTGTGASSTLGSPITASPSSVSHTTITIGGTRTGTSQPPLSFTSLPRAGNSTSAGTATGSTRPASSLPTSTVISTLTSTFHVTATAIATGVYPTDSAPYRTASSGFYTAPGPVSLSGYGSKPPVAHPTTSYDGPSTYAVYGPGGYENGWWFRGKQESKGEW